MRIIESYILQTRTESLKPCILFHDHIRCGIIFKIGFTNWNAKIALLRASMVVTYYIKLFWMGVDRHNSILKSLLLLVTETITLVYVHSEVAELVPLLYSRGRSTRYSDRLHDFFHHSEMLQGCLDVYVNSFFPCTGRLCISLPVECFPLIYDLNYFKSRIKIPFNCRFFLNRFLVCFNLFVLFFLVTPWL